jgi:hypothetical protein
MWNFFPYTLKMKRKIERRLCLQSNILSHASNLILEIKEMVLYHL